MCIAALPTLILQKKQNITWSQSVPFPDHSTINASTYLGFRKGVGYHSNEVFISHFSCISRVANILKCIGGI